MGEDGLGGSWGSRDLERGGGRGIRKEVGRRD